MIDMDRLIFILRFLVKLNYLKTLIINFRCLKLKDAILFPILIFGPCRLHHLRGKIKFDCKVKTGQLLIGISDPVRSSFAKSYISLLGNMIIGSHVVIRRGIKLSITGTLVLRDSVFIGDNNTIICSDRIEIDKATRLANNVSVMDTDLHYVINIDTREIKNNHAPIYIGENNWIGTYTMVKKRTKTPKGTIIAGPFSSIGKDLTNKIPENSFIAGSPVKLIRTGFRRINNKQSDAIIAYHFNKFDSNFVLDDNFDIDKFCMPQKLNGIEDDML